ncbi:hypothetical protein LTR95_008840 [Oleoguttula sp. CCFEE 5521]
MVHLSVLQSPLHQASKLRAASAISRPSTKDPRVVTGPTSEGEEPGRPRFESADPEVMRQTTPWTTALKEKMRNDDEYDPKIL